MPRNKKPRYCREFGGFDLFKPSGVPLSQLELVEIDLDELEAMRLCDLEGHHQERAAEEMGISRGTVQRLLQSGRTKLLDVILHGKALVVRECDHVLIRPRRGGRHRHGRRSQS